MTSLLRAWRKCRAGSTAVEFAVAFPLMATFAFGLFEFGRSIYVLTELNAAATRASRVLFVNYEASDTELENLLYAALPDYKPEDLSFAVSEKTDSGITYKVMTLSYNHNLTIPVGTVKSLTLESVRYTPVVAY